MKKLFTLALAMLASVGLWADPTLPTDATPTGTLDIINGDNAVTAATDAFNNSKHYLVYDLGNEIRVNALKGGKAAWVKGPKNDGGSSVSSITFADGVTDAEKYGFHTSSLNKWGIHSARYVGFRVMNCTEVAVTTKSNSTKDGKTAHLQVYVKNNTAWDYVEAIGASTYNNSKTYVLTTSALDATKEYVVLLTSESSSGSDAYEIRFASSTIAGVCPSGLSISGKKNYVEGEKIELTATLEAGNGDITYQWYKGGTEEANKLAGKTAAKLEIADCAGSDAGDYYCVASKADCDDAVNAAAYAVTVATIEPTGTATITYELSGSTVAGTATGVNSISGLSTSITLSTLTLSGTLDDYSGAIKGCNAATEVDEDYYADLQFTVANGYTFTPSAVSVMVNPFNATGAVKAVVKVMDSQLSVASNELSCAKNTDNAAVFADGAFTGKLFEGTVHLRMYFYGAASDKTFYLKSPITVAGTVAVAPTKYDVAFAAGEGTGSMATLKYVEGAEVTLPECTFTAPANKEFDAWTSSDVTITAGKFTMPAKNVTITATWKDAVTRYTVTYMEGETTLGSEEVEEGANPANYATYQSKQLASFVAWYNNADLAEEHKVANIAAEVINAAATYYAKFENAYATSVNFEKIVMENGKGYAIIPQLGTQYYASNITGSLDSLDNEKEDKLRNYAYLGLKVKQSGALLNFRLASGKTVKIKFGNIAKTPNVSINGGEYAAMVITNKVYEHTAAAEELISIKMMDGNAVVFQQIAIDEDFAAPELFAINCAEAAKGSVTTAYKLGIPGEKVTLTLTPAEGYKVDAVTLNEVAIVPVETVYSFTMPAAVANVAATFVEDDPTALDNTADAVKAVKRIENGQLFIEKNGVIYNAQGARLQ